MSTRSFLVSSLGFTLSALAAVMSANYFVDVSRVYHADDSHERTLITSATNTLQASAHGIVQPSWEGRAMKWELARMSQAECFVTGSSRAMPFGREQLEILGSDCRSVANLAVNGAGFEDLVTAAGLIADKPALKAVFIGIDPWLLRYGADARYTQFEAAYHAGRQRLGLAVKQQGSHWESAANLVNGQYLWRNVTFLAQGQAVDAIKEINADWSNVAENENVLRPDGSLVYSRLYRSAPPPPDGQVGNGSTKIQPPYLDARVAAEFEQIAERLRSRGAQITLLLTPYHPKVMRCESEKACAAIKAVEDWARELADRRGYRIMGSFDARRFGLGPEHFHDELHMNGAATSPPRTPHPDRLGPASRPISAGSSSPPCPPTAPSRPGGGG
jgi:hypothetical protein